MYECTSLKILMALQQTYLDNIEFFLLETIRHVATGRHNMDDAIKVNNH